MCHTRTLLIYFWPSLNSEAHMPLTGISLNCYFLATKKVIIVPYLRKGDQLRVCTLALSLFCPALLLFLQACHLITRQNETCTRLQGLWNERRNTGAKNPILKNKSQCTICYIPSSFCHVKEKVPDGGFSISLGPQGKTTNLPALLRWMWRVSKNHTCGFKSLRSGALFVAEA